MEKATRAALLEIGALVSRRFEEKATVHLTAAGESDVERAQARVQRAETRHSNAMESGDEARIQRAETELSNANEALDKALDAASDAPGWTPPEDDEIASLDEVIGMLRGKTDPVRESAVNDYFASFGQTAAAAGIRANWELTNPMIASMLERTGSNITNVAETTREAVRATMLKAYDAGLSVPDTAKAIQSMMVDASDARAVLIARTEFTGLVQGASLTGVQIVATATGDEYLKRWMTAPGAEYPRHEDYPDLDGQTVPLDGLFEVGDDMLAYPGDPDGEPGEVCNCRCDMAYLTAAEVRAEEDSQTAAGHPSTQLPSGGTVKHPTANGTNPGPEIVLEPVVGSASQLRWQAVLMVEGEATDDGRMIDPGAIDWRELPLSLMAQIETEDGHDGAQVAGRIDKIWRDGNRIMGEGVFDGGEYGVEIARLVGEQMLRGVSVDLAVREYEYRPKDGDETITEDDLMDILFGGADMLYVVTDGSIGAATVCAFPAFADAEIALVASTPLTWRATRQSGMTIVKVEASGDVDSPSEGEASAVTASAAGLVPVVPPAEWFNDPQLEEPTALHITDDGRLFGHAAVWDVCHIGFEDACVTAPRSETDYAYFHLGEVKVEVEQGEATTIPCGQISLGTGHADLRASKEAAIEHYDDTSTVAAHVVAGEDEHGIWLAGALAPDLPEERVRELRGAKISGDWRNVDGHLELVAMLAVNVPGFPVPRVAVASADTQPIAAALVSAGVADQRVLDGLAERQRIEKETADLAAEAIGTDELIAEARGAEVAATDAPFARR